MNDLEERFETDLAKLESKIDVGNPEVKELRVACRKTDLEIQPLMLVWTPWRVGPDGIAQPAYD